MPELWQCWCGQPKNHGGDKKLAANHSKISKQRYEQDKIERPHLYEKQEKRVYLPDNVRMQ